MKYYKIFDSLFRDKESGISFYGWDNLVKYEDFNLSRQDAFLGRWHYERGNEPESYKKYRWTVNKTKLLNKIFTDIFLLNANYISGKSKETIEVCKKGFKNIINHLNRVLAKEIDIKEKIEKLILRKEEKTHPFHSIQYHQKLIYNTMNQFHPKFLEKLPMNVQIYINKAMKYMVERLTQELEKLS